MLATMVLLRVLLLSLLTCRAAAHTPAGAGQGTRENPQDLGDVTKNSWALTGIMKPNEIYHYKFTIPEEGTPKDASSNDPRRFYLGYYVPGAGEPDFTFYVAVFGMGNDTECELWGDGWGRRNRRNLGGGGHHSHAESTSVTATPDRVTSKGTTWLRNSDQVPERVTGISDGHKHVHAGEFNYHNPSQTLVFIASPATDRPNKFEPFSPTVFKPRGSCIADFPRGGEYRIAVWGEPGQVGDKHFCVGLGLAERDVFAPANLITFAYILFGIQTWNGWNGFVLVLPMLIFLIVALAANPLFKYLRPQHFGTTKGWPTPFRAIVLCVAGIFLGHMVMNIAILAWATSMARVEGGLGMPIMLQIVLPLVSTTCLTLIGVNIPVCCCCRPRSAVAGIPYRITVAAFGLLHLFLQLGYIVGPVLLFIAALLPPVIADFDHKDLGQSYCGGSDSDDSSDSSGSRKHNQVSP